MGATADLVRRWAELYNDGSAEEYGSDEFLQLYAEDVDWVEAPTAVTPEGRAGGGVQATSSAYARSIEIAGASHFEFDGDGRILRYWVFFDQSGFRG